MPVGIYIVDAFAGRPFTGNPAGVVTRADGLSATQMQRIARELGQTETCFVAEGARPDADFHLRWFTPTVEVDLCGHATVAAYLCLLREGRLRLVDGSAYIRHRTRSGLLGVWVSAVEGQPASVMMSAGVAPMRPAPDDRDMVARVIGLDPATIDPDLPLAVDDSAARLIVPVRRLEELLALVPDTSAMQRHAAYRRFTLVCLETRDARCTTHLRHFAPANGIPEDPVTGTAHAAIATYLDRQGLLPPGARVDYLGEQGHAVGRPGMVTVEVHRDGAAIADVRIGGGGFIVARGEIEVPRAGQDP
jgi:trans-2,3-dihydro-3-hydroxyanthranilate isomerase